MLTASRAPAVDEQMLDPYFAALRRREFAALDATGLAYLDYTGSALPSARQIDAHNETLRAEIFGNPHADSAPSRRSTAVLDDARSLVLRHLDADDAEYTVVFTANATAASKLVGESYPFSPDGICLLSADNHNSVNGIREYARRAGARILYLPLDYTLRPTNPASVLAESRRVLGSKLFAFPAQSNFSGVRHSLAAIDAAHDAGFDVLLDAAAYLPTSGLSLRRHPADFVAFSFYKLFGYPTGLGALVARRQALARLRRPWFAGGAVEYVSVQTELHSLAPDHAGFEDGTPNFLAVAALPAGFALLAEVGMERLASHVGCLTATLIEALQALLHRNGRAVIRLHGPATTDDRGGTVAFNVVRPDGGIVPYWLVEELARQRGVAVRGGCFCNPGAAEAAFGFEREAAARCLQAAGANGRFTIQRFAACLSPKGEQPVGAVRASLGMANNAADVARLVDVLRSFVE